KPEPVNPVITSFTPTAGLAGTTEVVISGENFSATIADDVVKIGNVLATVTGATTTSITITVPAEAVTGKISVTVKETTVLSANDFVVVTGPSDFFTLTVDANYETSQIDTWILASSKSGDWIDVQPYESGETKILNGVVPDANSFTLHFLTISQQLGNYYCSMKSIADVPVNGTWLLKTATSTASDPKILTLNVNNYMPADRDGYNDIMSVSSNEGTGSYSISTSGNTVNMDVSVLKSPADILVTLHENGYPKYVTYKNVTIPSTITIDASTEGVAADRKFTMKLPTNSRLSVAIDAFEESQKVGYSMSKYFNFNGSTSVDLGYMQGYQKYRTFISYRDGNKMVDLLTVGSAVEETHTFPPFDFTFTNSNVNDFQAVSVLPFDLATTDFQYNLPGMALLWNVVQPASGTTRAINFKAKAFPQEIRDKHPFLPSVDQVPVSIIYAYQITGGKKYSDMIDAASKSGNVLVDLLSDNVFRFAKERN
ncbi:MAG TPA: IPT/TIG domain-containing protein, partial [Chryseolinea sp.]|nr:IPT/TIG domain-containing protein [Chryseolinea sp.]